MGNRAVITQSIDDNAPAIYLHWSGGRESINGFLSAARAIGMNGKSANTIDAISALIAVHFFNTAVNVSTVYREEYAQTDRDNWDNGVYVIDGSLKITSRLFMQRPDSLDIESTKAIKAQILQSYEDYMEESVIEWN